VKSRWSEDAGHVVHLVPPALIFRGGLVNEIGMLDPIAVHHWNRIGVGVLDDLPQFGRRDLGGYRLASVADVGSGAF
jgi:hypothetical protein